MDYKIVIALLAAVIVTVFALQNSAAVDINFLFFSFKMSLALVIMISTILGAVIVLIVSLIKQLSLRKNIKELTSNILVLEKENADLKTKVNPPIG